MTTNCVAKSRMQTAFVAWPLSWGLICARQRYKYYFFASTLDIPLYHLLFSFNFGNAGFEIEIDIEKGNPQSHDLCRSHKIICITKSYVPKNRYIKERSFSSMICSPKRC